MEQKGEILMAFLIISLCVLFKVIFFLGGLLLSILGAIVTYFVAMWALGEFFKAFEPTPKKP